jgi:death-on-curing protein
MRRWPWDTVITTDDIVLLYTLGMDRYGGRRSAPFGGCLEARLGAAHHAELYHADPGVSPGLRFAVSLMVYLIKDHCFVDGNKRIGWACLVFVLLRRFRLTIDATDEQAEQLLDDILTKHLSIDDAMRWVGSRLVAA